MSGLTLAESIAHLADSQIEDLRERVGAKRRDLRAQIDALAALDRVIRLDLKARAGERRAP